MRQLNILIPDLPEGEKKKVLKNKRKTKEKKKKGEKIVCFLKK